MATAFLFSASGLGPLSSSAGKEQYLIIVNLILAALKCNWVLESAGLIGIIVWSKEPTFLKLLSQNSIHV